MKVDADRVRKDTLVGETVYETQAIHETLGVCFLHNPVLFQPEKLGALVILL